ncbi:Putative protein of unknown function [Podospora comata]|uniref:Phospholipase n=1 Tax=Podospora comata TaxID=48703 RepID=A0ABY6RZV0_PODCO|nr:Putative protein of unknown function [Podospora comata]
MVIHSLLRKAKQGLNDILPGEDKHSHTHEGYQCRESECAEFSENRHCSFAPRTRGNAKWYVDGATYFWAISMAIEEARESIYILDWWLSPELYLRRPPAQNEKYRLDRLLKAAAERGVRVYVLVYKEVEAALTLNSAHTKNHLQGLHPNIKVFRYPDHHPAKNVVSGLQDLHTSLVSLDLKNFNLAKASQSAVEGLYGTADDVVLFWAHHEKLCLVDGRVAFMGGLDMCFGRYDTNSHPIADAHPGNLDNIIFPGQDFNNARVYDFEEVNKWENNKRKWNQHLPCSWLILTILVDRTKASRMGWADVAISLSGPIVDSLATHFCERWNYIFDKKYSGRTNLKVHRLTAPGVQKHSDYGAHALMDQGEELLGGVQSKITSKLGKFWGGGGEEAGVSQVQAPPHPPVCNANEHGIANIQLARSVSKWSLGVRTEHSIANAYIDAITNAKHFVYIENQFFITATSNKQRPVHNKIGKAIVDRVLRAHINNEDFQIIIMMPAVPAFAGDLKSEGALGTRAIMEFQYNSINRGGSSIIETLRREGVHDPYRYINWYNLRNYDRINRSQIMTRAERESGVSYEAAHRDFEDRYNSSNSGGNNSYYRRYQATATSLTDQSWDTVSPCYMESGLSILGVPWTGSPQDELDAFVSEQLYIHTKVLIADDQLVICGSANLNDRSQLGDHDSEIAVIIEDPTPIRTYMNGRPYTASQFATSLRRFLYRKHLGLVPHQHPDRPDINWTPVTHDAVNHYDWDSPSDRLVADPLSPDFINLWRGTARRNTEIFSRAFHPVPNDKVRTWEDYDNFFSKHFVIPGEPAEQAEEGYKNGKVDYGHVVRENFPGGVGELKMWLSGIRGNLVEMPLNFLIDVPDIAEDGLALNSLTDELYT